MDSMTAEMNLALACSCSELPLRFVPVTPMSASAAAPCSTVQGHSEGISQGRIELSCHFSLWGIPWCLFGPRFISCVYDRIWWLKPTAWDPKWIVCFLMKCYASAVPSPLHTHTHTRAFTQGLHHTANCLYTCKQISSQIISYHQVGCGARCSRGWGCLSICQGQPDTKNKQHKPGMVVTRGRENLSGRSVWAGKMIMWHDTSEMRHWLPWWGVRRDYLSRGWNKTCFKWCLIRI